MKRGLLLRNRRALTSHQLYLRNLWWLLTAGTPASVLKMIWQDKKAVGTKEVQSARLRLHLRHAFAHGVKNGRNPTRGELNCLHKDSCCHPPRAQTFWPAPACLFLLTNTVCLRVFRAICRVSRVQTNHFLCSLTSFQEANWENNLKSARIYRELSNLSYISQNASLKWKPVYRKKKKKKRNPMLAKGSVRKGRERGKWMKTSCLLESTTVIPFCCLPLSCPVGMWANYHDLYMPAAVLHGIYYTQLFVENSACVGSSWIKKPNKSQNFQNLTFPALLAASTSCTSQWKLTFPPTPWISSKLRFDPDVLISTQLKCNQMLDFGG